ncbi:hypothetical protein N8077_05475, partial [Myxococcota bacterium]|nr:hypothetical protein [Myxococcota bacterium]
MTRAEMPTTIDGLREMVLRQQALLEDQRSEIETQSEVLDANRSTIESNATLIDEQAELITFYREWKRLIDSQ